PSWETLPHERLSPRSDTVGRRLAVLRRLRHPDPTGEGHDRPGLLRDVFDVLWPQAINRAVSEFIASWGDPSAAARSAQWASGLTAFWHDVSTALGSPELIYPDAPPPLDLAALLPGIGENP
ncbi:hypothetical protein, partial [uncultured Bradyrhizobium sp.]|uniref:hypothetical protein n=1 Tax=uncultured Bradyrhizobium sp. TaxID=199684 RepID=UPI00261BE826